MNERMLVDIALCVIFVAGVLGSVFPIVDTIDTVVLIVGLVILLIGIAMRIAHEIHGHRNQPYRESRHVSDTRNT